MKWSVWTLPFTAEPLKPAPKGVACKSVWIKAPPLKVPAISGLKPTTNGVEVPPCATTCGACSLRNEYTEPPASIVADWMVTACAQPFTPTNFRFPFAQN